MRSGRSNAHSGKAWTELRSRSPTSERQVAACRAVRIGCAGVKRAAVTARSCRAGRAVSSGEAGLRFRIGTGRWAEPA